jgi:glycosyltransferase involved in cell wall biosynthesis
MADSPRETILLIGPVPPPVFGQAIAVDALLSARELQEAWTLLHINTNSVGKGITRKVLFAVRSLMQYLWSFIVYRPSLVYLTVTRSKLGFLKDLIVVWFASLWAVPAVVHLHGGDLAVFQHGLTPFWRRRILAMYRRVSLGIALGESLRSQFDGLLPPERVRVVLNCWPDDECGVLPYRTERPADRPLRLAFISNVLPSKGLYDTVCGVAWAIQHGVKLEFRFAGKFLDHDGAIAKLPEFSRENHPARDLEDCYDRLVGDLGIANHVVRLGGVAGRQKWELLAETDILLLPIYNPTEGQPLVAIEAMRAGCVLVCTQCGGLVDVVEDGVTGKVVPPRNPVEIGKAIKWFWDHPGEVKRIGNANMTRAEGMHSPREHIHRIRAIFDEVLSDSGKTPEGCHVV